MTSGIEAVVHSPFYGLMDNHGMLPADWTCRNCGKVLNLNDSRPAELYAGTYTGLCYACTSGGAYIAKTFVLDGAHEWSYPPHCPSWRRDRENFTAYPDCPTCLGSGVAGRGHSMGGGTFPLHCKACSERFYSHPLRSHHAWLQKKLDETAQARYERLLAEAAGATKLKGKKRQAAINEVAEDDERARPLRIAILVQHASAKARLAGLAGRWRIYETESHQPAEVAA